MDKILQVHTIRIDFFASEFVSPNEDRREKAKSFISDMGDQDVVDSAAVAVSSHRVKNSTDSFYASAIRFGYDKFG